MVPLPQISAIYGPIATKFFLRNEDLPRTKTAHFARNQETGKKKKKIESENWFFSNDNFCIFFYSTDMDQILTIDPNGQEPETLKREF